MTDLRGWALPEQHLAPDAVVAFVDGELSALAHERAATHLARCPFCAEEAEVQRQVSAALRSAPTPPPPTRLLEALRTIPQRVELPSMPDNLTFTDDGQLVTLLRPLSGKPRNGQARGALGGTAPLGSSRPLGSGPLVLGRRAARRGKHTKQGAGLLVSGLVLGALALVNPVTPTVEPTAASGEAESPALPVEAPAAGLPAAVGTQPAAPGGDVVGEIASAPRTVPEGSLDQRSVAFSPAPVGFAVHRDGLTQEPQPAPWSSIVQLPGFPSPPQPPFLGAVGH
ncbi:MAG TPA: hypothetical protein VIL00_18745 [Pseudonocardiaceae bacterium]